MVRKGRTHERPKDPHLHADTTTDAKELREPCNLCLRCDFNAKLACGEENISKASPHRLVLPTLENHRTRSLALLPTSSRFASLCVDNSDTSQAVGHVTTTQRSEKGPRRR